MSGDRGVTVPAAELSRRQAKLQRQILILEAWGQLYTPAALEPGDCWLWPGSTNDTGYGSCKRNGEALVHRAAWVELFGPIGAGLLVRHRCDTPACYRPSHLLLGTHADNVADKMARGRQFIADGRSDARIKLTDDQVHEIRQQVTEGDMYVTVAHRFGVAPQTVRLIALGLRRTRPIGATPARPAEGTTATRVTPGKKPAPPVCPQGHNLTGANLAIRPNGHRWCRACARDRRLAARPKAAA